MDKIMDMININDMVYVYLTESGKRIMESEYAWRLKEPFYNNKTGLYHEQLWTLMQVFGPKMWLGCPEFPFKMGRIYFSKPVEHKDNPKCIGCEKFMSYSDDYPEEENTMRNPDNCTNYLANNCCPKGF